MFDWCANGQQLKCLTVTDEWTKEGLAIEVDGRIRSRRVIEVLSRLVSERGAPLYLRSDNGPEFVSRALLKWIVDQGHRHRIDRSRQALAEWRDGELQRQVPRRVPEPRMVPVADRGEGADRSVAEALQHGAAAFEPRLSHAGRVRGQARAARRSGAPSDGADRCGIWGLRAPPRRITVPQGANERRDEGRVPRIGFQWGASICQINQHAPTSCSPKARRPLTLRRLQGLSACRSGRPAFTDLSRRA